MGSGCGAVEGVGVRVGGVFGGAGTRGGEGAVLGFFYCLWWRCLVSLSFELRQKKRREVRYRVGPMRTSVHLVEGSKPNPLSCLRSL